MQNSIAMVIMVLRMTAKTPQKEEAKPKPAEAPPRAERGEKYEKHEKGEKREKGEKHEKGEYEKGEKHEKRGFGVWGSVIAGLLLIVFGVLAYLVNVYGLQYLWWPIFLIVIGVAIIAYAFVITSARRRSPPPP